MISNNDYAALSAATYDDGGVGQASEGWTRLGNYSNPDNGFFAALYENSSGERVLAFRGTEPAEPLIGNANSTKGTDGQTDIDVLYGRLPKQFDDAKNTYDKVVESYGSDGLSLTGHSLGGGLASFVAAQDTSEIN